MTTDGMNTYTYDAESRITSDNGVNYVYDGDGLRVKKSSGTLYWRSITGETLAESDLSGNIQNDYVLFAGRRIARVSGSTVNYFYSDGLGTVHTITDPTGHPCYDATFTPYGQEVTNPNVSQTCPSNYKFTGYEYDSETGLYYALGRYYNWRFGRYMSPDPIGGDSSDPQSLNGYAFVLNNPCNLTDPLGLDPNCNFNVAIRNQAGDKVGTQLKAIEAQIQALFSASSNGQPNSVGVNFTSSGGADATLTFNNNGVPGSDMGGYTSSYWLLGTHYSNSSTVFANLVSPGPYFTRTLGVEGGARTGTFIRTHRRHTVQSTNWINPHERR